MSCARCHAESAHLFEVFCPVNSSFKVLFFPPFYLWEAAFPQDVQIRFCIFEQRFHGGMLWLLHVISKWTYTYTRKCHMTFAANNDRGYLARDLQMDEKLQELVFSLESGLSTFLNEARVRKKCFTTLNTI